MTINPIEKEQVEWVFGLTGGELEDKPWRVAELETLDRHWFQYWYEGPPDYIDRTLRRRGGEYRTAVVCALYGEPPEKLIRGGRVWKRVKMYLNSGEVECPGAGDGDGIVTHEAFVAPNGDACQLCEAKLGEKHEYIYIGDGWVEAVYRAKE